MYLIVLIILPSQTELVGAGYWGAVVTFVLHKLSSSLSLCPNKSTEDDEFFSEDLFLELFTLHSDMKYIALHFSFVSPCIEDFLITPAMQYLLIFI